MKTDEQEIRLKDLWLHYTRRWKSILLVTVFFAVLLGGWQAIQVGKVHGAGEKTKDELRYERDMATYHEVLGNAEHNVAERKRWVEEKAAYRDGSILMNLDPSAVWTAEKKYLVSPPVSGAGESSGGTLANSGDLLAVYTGAMGTDHDLAALAEAFGTENAGFAGEVVSIASDPAENSFTVKVYGASEEAAKKGMAYVSGKISEAETRAQGIAAHTLTALEEGTSLQILPELTEKKSALTDTIYGYERALREAERTLDNAKESYPSDPGDPVVRWAIAGGVLAFLAMLGIYLTTFLRKH